MTKKDGYIMVAPLNWGLGHATRCVPIINVLLELGYQPILASDGRALSLLKVEFPDLPTIELPSYNITYGPNNQVWQMLKLTPSILKAIYSEHQLLKKMIPQYNIKAVISDNRFGLWNKEIPSAFLTHQLFIQSNSKYIQKIINAINHKFIQQFDVCWIPDFEGVPNLSGDLGHYLNDKPIKLDQCTYLAPLSRMKKTPSNKKTPKHPLCIVLSGPEPQRTFLETLILEQLKQLEKPLINCILIRGKTEGNETIKQHGNMQIVDFLSKNALQETIENAGLVICRAGYSSIMDLFVLQKDAVLIPTPGQTEQEYLAKKLKAEGVFYTCDQSSFDLKQALEHAKKYKGWKGFKEQANNLLKKAIKEFLKLPNDT